MAIKTFYFCRKTSKTEFVELSYKKHTLKFRFDAGTSRGIYREKPTWIIEITHRDITGYGECGPLKGLSIESFDELEPKLAELQEIFPDLDSPSTEKEVYQLALKYAGYNLPSLRFGLETAMLDLMNGGKKVIFNNGFVNGDIRIPINGLVWMGSVDFMKKQIDEKPAKGFKCLKMKIGALSLKEEFEMIGYIRDKYPDITLRLDANGAFKTYEALMLLKKISRYDIHSIEQPIRPGQLKEMKQLCLQSPVPIALDEEMIGINSMEEKYELLQHIKPQFIILKPSLLGGFSACNEWITLAEKLDIGWWITSMLESNIGLNAIAQYTAEVKAESFQGLGTGELYTNNFDSGLRIKNGYIFNEK